MNIESITDAANILIKFIDEKYINSVKEDGLYCPRLSTFSSKRT